MGDRPRVALVHDYLTQRGGAERVVVSMLRAFPGAPLYTSLYAPEETFPEFASADVRVLSLNRVRSFRTDHRRALPLLSSAFNRLRVEADVVICSSSGWAHAANVDGTKIVYCHNPARWLYQSDQYLARSGQLRRVALATIASRLRARDQAAAATASLYVANSRVVQERIREVYGRDSILLHPPPALTPQGPHASLDIEPGFFLCVSRLMAYKNVDVLVDAFGQLPRERLVVVGTGPDADSLMRRASSNVRFVGRVDDGRLRWLYSNSRALVAASYEDFGLTPLEAAMFGKPSVALRWGGFRETIVEGETGVFFEEPHEAAVVGAILQLGDQEWDAPAIRSHADTYSDDRFVKELRSIAMDPHVSPRES